MAADNLSLVRSSARRQSLRAHLLPLFIASLIEAARVIRPEPRAVRARQLLRARAVIAASRAFGG